MARVRNRSRKKSQRVNRSRKFRSKGRRINTKTKQRTNIRKSKRRRRINTKTKRRINIQKSKRRRRINTRKKKLKKRGGTLKQAALNSKQMFVLKIMKEMKPDGILFFIAFSAVCENLDLGKTIEKLGNALMSDNMEIPQIDKADLINLFNQLISVGGCIRLSNETILEMNKHFHFIETFKNIFRKHSWSKTFVKSVLHKYKSEKTVQASFFRDALQKMQREPRLAGKTLHKPSSVIGHGMVPGMMVPGMMVPVNGGSSGRDLERGTQGSDDDHDAAGPAPPTAALMAWNSPSLPQPVLSFHPPNVPDDGLWTVIVRRMDSFVEYMRGIREGRQEEAAAGGGCWVSFRQALGVTFIVEALGVGAMFAADYSERAMAQWVVAIFAGVVAFFVVSVFFTKFSGRTPIQFLIYIVSRFFRSAAQSPRTAVEQVMETAAVAERDRPAIEEGTGRERLDNIGPV